MIHRIVLVRSHRPYEAAYAAKSFERAGRTLERAITVRGTQFDEKYYPVRVLGQADWPDDRFRAMGFHYDRIGPVKTFAVRAKFADEEAINRMRADRSQEVMGIFADPTITVFRRPYCGSKPVGTHRDVARSLGVRSLKRWKLTGKGVRVAVVDTGINGKIIPVHGGWAPVPGYIPGSREPDHGTMVALDVRIAAPDAWILDYALLTSQKNTWTAFLSDAIAAFADLIGLLAREPGPLVVNNSWGMFNRSEDAPIGSPENYSANPQHPFNQITGSLVAAGADVFFAAGNCGGDCPDGRCGRRDIGPGASIHGANSHPDVVTVAAVTVDDRRLGYSSQGPGGLHKRKPDLAAYSHFQGSGVYDVHGGTSAASPVAAGVAAALRQEYAPARITPAQLKGVLHKTCRDLPGQVWNYDTGYGVIDAAAAARSLRRKRGKN